MLFNTYSNICRLKLHTCCNFERFSVKTTIINILLASHYCQIFYLIPHNSHDIFDDDGRPLKQTSYNSLFYNIDLLTPNTFDDL